MKKFLKYAREHIGQFLWLAVLICILVFAILGNVKASAYVVNEIVANDYGEVTDGNFAIVVYGYELQASAESDIQSGIECFDYVIGEYDSSGTLLDVYYSLSCDHVETWSEGLSNINSSCFYYWIGLYNGTGDLVRYSGVISSAHELLYTNLSPTIDSYEAYITGSTPVTYSLTIHYQTSAGVTLAPDYSGTYEAGSSYSVTSPVISGYNAQHTVVSGTIEHDTEFTVLYTAASTSQYYTLVIKYQDMNGNSVADTYSQSWLGGSYYSVASPSVDGYQASQSVVSGTINGDTVLTVVYIPVTAEGVLGGYTAEQVKEAYNTGYNNGYVDGGNGNGTNPIAGFFEGIFGALTDAYMTITSGISIGGITLGNLVVTIIICIILVFVAKLVFKS